LEVLGIAYHCLAMLRKKRGQIPEIAFFHPHIWGAVIYAFCGLFLQQIAEPVEQGVAETGVESLC